MLGMGTCFARAAVVIAWAPDVGFKFAVALARSCVTVTPTRLGSPIFESDIERVGSPLSARINSCIHTFCTTGVALLGLLSSLMHTVTTAELSEVLMMVDVVFRVETSEHQ